MKLVPLVRHLLAEKLEPLALVVVGAVDYLGAQELGSQLDLTLLATGAAALGVHLQTVLTAPKAA